MNRDGRLTEHVDPTLDKHVGNRKDRTLNSCRDTDRQHLFQLICIDPHPVKPEAELIIPAVQMGDNEECADHVGDHVAMARRNSQMESDHKEQV